MISQRIELTYTGKQIALFFPKEFPKYTVVPKGRRAGLTRGAAHAFIEYGLDEDFDFLPKGPLLGLWGDTIAGNIDKYYERYFLPALKKVPRQLWKWKAQERILMIGRLTVDFRSADRPENWEGFGYHLIFLNEAGIILEDDYLFNNAVMPMLVDFPNAKLIAAGVPKGKRHKLGMHKFYELYQEALKDKIGRYRIIRMTGYDNRYISREELSIIANSLDDETRKQEIDGEFIDLTDKKFLYKFKESKHVVPEYKPNKHLPIVISFDFNKEPMTSLIGQKVDIMTCYVFDEIEMPNGSTEEICDEILSKYPEYRLNWDITGDATGRNRNAMVRGNLNNYHIIQQKLDLADDNILTPKQNPAIKDSRVTCNSVLQKANVFITENCQTTINDCIDAAVDDKGELIKTDKQGRHMLDNFRYLMEAFFPGFIRHPERYSADEE